MYLENGELVDLHEDYGNCVCYLTEDGLSGFAIEEDGNLVSVFNSGRPGFLRTIKDYMEEQGATHLDGYSSTLQPLDQIYSKVFGWHVAARMDYNMDFDHDGIAENHGMPDVAFMTQAEAEEKRFGKDEYDAAKAWQMQFVEREVRHQIAGRAGAERLGIRGLGDAEAMERSGATREEIWRETGWWRGADGKWRVEIPDFTLTMETIDREAYQNDPEFFVRKRKLSDIVKDTALFDAYPQLRRVTVQTPHSDKFGGLNTFGNYNNGTRIRLNMSAMKFDPEEVRATLAHEIQHAIQKMEGVAQGGNAGMFKPVDAAKLRRKAEAERRRGNETEAERLESEADELEENALDGMVVVEQTGYMDSFEAYQSLAGEVEARNVEKRLKMTPEERAATPPWATEDVEEGRQIVRHSVVSLADGTRLAAVTDFEEARKLAKATPDQVEQYLLAHLEDNLPLWAGGTVRIDETSAHHFAWSPYNLAPVPRSMHKARGRAATIIADILSTVRADRSTSEKDKYGGSELVWRCRVPFAIPAFENDGTLTGVTVFDGDVIIKDSGDGKYFYDLTNLKRNAALTVTAIGQLDLFRPPSQSTPGNGDASLQARLQGSQASPGAEVKAENVGDGRKAVQGRVRAFDDVPRYSPRGTMAALATLPWETEDVEEGRQIVRHSVQGSAPTFTDKETVKQNWALALQLPPRRIGFDEPRVENRKELREHFHAWGDVTNRADGTKAFFSGNDAGKFMNRSDGVMNRVGPHLKELFEGAVPFCEANPETWKDHKEHREASLYRYFLNRITLVDENGKEENFIVRMTVRVAKGAVQVHDGKVSLEGLYKESDLSNLGRSQTGGKERSPYLDPRLADILRYVNGIPPARPGAQFARITDTGRKAGGRERASRLPNAGHSSRMEA